MVDPQLVAERQVKAGVHSLAQQVSGQVFATVQEHPGQSEFAFLVVEVGVIERRLADQELRHVVQPQLVEMVAADHHEHVRPRAGQRLAESLDLGPPFVSERRAVLAGGGARAVIERVMGGCDDGGDGRHGGSLRC